MKTGFKFLLLLLIFIYEGVNAQKNCLADTISVEALFSACKASCVENDLALSQQLSLKENNKIRVFQADSVNSKTLWEEEVRQIFIIKESQQPALCAFFILLKFKNKDKLITYLNNHFGPYKVATITTWGDENDDNNDFYFYRWQKNDTLIEARFTDLEFTFKESLKTFSEAEITVKKLLQ